MLDKVIFGDELYSVYENKTLLENLALNKYIDI